MCGLAVDKCGGDFLFVETLFQLRVRMAAYAKPGVGNARLMLDVLFKAGRCCISRILISQSVLGKDMSGKEAHVIVLCICE